MKALLNKPILKGILSLLVIFTPIQHTVYAVLALVTADLILGLMGAKKRKEKLTSATLSRTANKIFVYLSALVLSFITQKYIINDAFQLINIVGMYVSLNELTSVLENLNEINGKPIFKGLIQRLNVKKNHEE